MQFSLSALLKVLSEMPQSPCYWVGLSGGLDSVVLLRSLVLVKKHFHWQLKAVYINHHWHAQADQWGIWCQRLCLQENIFFIQQDVYPSKAGNLEANARSARYQAFAELLETKDSLLTAHHQDDQAETFLLQLFRGSGPLGLAAMPPIQSFAQGFHIRPLLFFSRADLAYFAQQQGWTWIEDPSNQDIRYARNFLRHKIIPQLETYYPGVKTALARSAQLQAETVELLDNLAFEDLKKIQGPLKNTLSIQVIKQLSLSQQHNVIRFWLRQLQFSLPSQVKLKEIIQIFSVKSDSNPLISWDNIEIRRYQDLLYAMPKLCFPQKDQILYIQDTTPVDLVCIQKQLIWQTTDYGIDIQMLRKGFMIKFRQGGEKCKLAGNKYVKPVKQIFQEKHIPPWERQYLPFLYQNNQLVAIANIGVCQPFASYGKVFTPILKDIL